MYQLKFFSSLSRQRRALLAAKSFAPIPLHPAVERQLALATSIDDKPPTIERPLQLIWYSLMGIKRLVIETIAWNAVSALVVLSSIVVARQVFRAQAGVREGLLLALGYLVLKLVQAAVENVNARRRLQIHRGLQVTLFRCVNSKLIHLSPAGRARFSKGQLKTLVASDVNSVEDFLSAALLQWTPLLVSSVILVPVLYMESGSVGLVALCAALLLIPVASGGAAVVEYFQRLAQGEQDRLATVIGEWVKNIRLVRFLGWDRACEGEVLRTMRSFVVLGSIRHAVIVTVWAFSFSWSMLPLLAIVWLSSRQSSTLNLVEVFSSFWLLDHLLHQIQYIPFSLSLFGAASAGSKRIIELLRQPNIESLMLPVPAGSGIGGEEPAKIVLRDVTVAYESHTALDRVSLELRCDEKTAIVGGVGSGKTTLLEAIVGEIPVSSGDLVIEWRGGKRLPLWREDVYRRFRSLVAYSPQHPFLSNATLRCNVDLSGARSHEEVDMAVAAAQLYDDLAVFPQGLEEEVGESGINLSGGQKQRVSLARAFISRRPLLVLDDPLSAVDPRTEGLLMDAIRAHSQGFILVSHRLAELTRCDRVLVLDRGRVVEDGSPKLLAADSRSRFSQFLKAVEAHEY